MIAVSLQSVLTDAERSQLERKELAIGAWREGQIENALLILESIMSEEMSPRVTAECLVAQSAFRQAAGDFEGSMESLKQAGPLIEHVDQSIQAAFHHQRGRAHKKAGNIDAAITDYSGAASYWEAIGDPNYGAPMLNLADLYLKLGDLPAARENIEKAISVFVETDSIYLCQGYDTWADIELASGNLELAVVLIRKALDLVNNDLWRKGFIETKDRIETKLLELLGVETVEDLTAVQVGMVRRALIKEGGNLTRAGKLTGLTHKGVSFIVDHHPELEPYRAKRRTRTKLKSIFK